MSCKQPLVPSLLKDYECSPPCPTSDWLLKEETLSGLTSANLVLLALVFVSSLVVIYTWMRVKELYDALETFVYIYLSAAVCVVFQA